MARVPKVIKFPPVGTKTPHELLKFMINIDSFLVDLKELEKRDQKANAYVGTFLGQILAIEKKMDLALLKVYPDIEDTTLGGKIIVLKKFLDHIDLDPNLETLGSEAMRYFVPSLEEILDVRNRFAHNFDYIYCPISDIPITLAFIDSWVMAYPKEKLAAEKDDSIKSLLAITIFSRFICEKLSCLAFAQT